MFGNFDTKRTKFSFFVFISWNKQHLRAFNSFETRDRYIWCSLRYFLFAVKKWTKKKKNFGTRAILNYSLFPIIFEPCARTEYIVHFCIDEILFFFLLIKRITTHCGGYDAMVACLSLWLNTDHTLMINRVDVEITSPHVSEWISNSCYKIDWKFHSEMTSWSEKNRLQLISFFFTFKDPITMYFSNA